MHPPARGKRAADCFRRAGRRPGARDAVSAGRDQRCGYAARMRRHACRHRTRLAAALFFTAVCTQPRLATAGGHWAWSADLRHLLTLPLLALVLPWQAAGRCGAPCAPTLAPAAVERRRLLACSACASPGRPQAGCPGCLPAPSSSPSSPACCWRRCSYRDARARLPNGRSLWACSSSAASPCCSSATFTARSTAAPGSPWAASAWPRSSPAGQPLIRCTWNAAVRTPMPASACSA